MPSRLPASPRPPKDRWLRALVDRERALPPPRLAVLRLARLLRALEVVGREREEVVWLPNRLPDRDRLSPPVDAPVLARVRWDVPDRLRKLLAAPRFVVPRVVVPRVVVPRVVVPRAAPLRDEDQLLRRPIAAWLRAARPGSLDRVAAGVLDRVVDRVVDRPEERFTPEGAAKRERLPEPERENVDREREELLDGVLRLDRLGLDDRE